MSLKKIHVLFSHLACVFHHSADGSSSPPSLITSSSCPTLLSLSPLLPLSLHLPPQVEVVTYDDEGSSDSEHDAYRARMIAEGEEKDSEDGKTSLMPKLTLGSNP